LETISSNTFFVSASRFAASFSSPASFSSACGGTAVRFTSTRWCVPRILVETLLPVVAALCVIVARVVVIVLVIVVIAVIIVDPSIRRSVRREVTSADTTKQSSLLLRVDVITSKMTS
jgi:hypothetical protein